MLRRADDQAANNVDKQDQDTGDRIAANELAGAVHRAIQVGFLANFLAPHARLILVDNPGIQIRVDRHLLARHGVERESCGDLGDATRAFRHNDKVDDHENTEDNEADRVVAANHELAECLDNLARCPGAGVAVEQYHAR